MMRIKYILVLMLLLLVNSAFAKKNERSYIRSGNRLFNDSAFVKAEVDYRKAIEINPRSSEALYCLGNSLIMQEKFEEAMKQYDLAGKLETNKLKLSQIYHNMGVILQTEKQYPQCIEAYKEALRNNPKDDETRYNLALAQKMLKDQQDNQENQEQEKDQEQEKEQKQEQEQKQDQQQQDQQQQTPPPPKPENEMSKENAQQLLNAAMQDEKETQEKIQKQQQQVQSRKLDKDW